MVCQMVKPMLCMRVGLHENDGNHENDEDTSESYNRVHAKGVMQPHAS